MRISQSAAYALGVAAAVAMLAGCSSGGSQSGYVPPGQTGGTQSSAQKAHPAQSQLGLEQLETFLYCTVGDGSYCDNGKVVANNLRKHHNRSYMKHLTTPSGTTLYVADAAEESVYVYSWNTGFSKGTMLGQLGGPGSGYFVLPTGLCTDKSWNIYVVDAGGPTFGLPGVWEFAHNQIYPINSWADAGNVPLSCSVDSSGNLAVTNWATTTGGSGSVYVYPGGGQNQTPYYNIGQSVAPLLNVFYAGWDSSGNLFADGTYCCVSFPHIDDNEEVELAKGGNYFSVLGLVGVPLTQIQWPGQVQFAKKRVNAGDIQTNNLNSPVACINEATNHLGCGAQYETKVANGFMTQLGVTNFVQSPIALGTWISGTDNQTIVPNTDGNGFVGISSPACLTPQSPSRTCTLVYGYGLGVQPVEEIDQPNYQLFPMAAVISQGP